MESLNITLLFRRLEANTNQKAINFVKAALSSSRSLVVGLLVGWSVGRLVCRSETFMQKVTFRVSNGN